MKRYYSRDIKSKDHHNTTMAVENRPKSKMIQSVLILPSSSKKITCSICDMTYNPNIHEDKTLHNKHHAKFINGIPWNISNDTDVSILENFILLQKASTIKSSNKKLRSLSTGHSIKCSIITIKKSNKKHTQKVDTVLAMVNQELNASQDSGQWKKLEFDKSKAFIVIIDGKAVGLCTTDTIQPNQGRWMVHKTQEVVPKQINKHAIIGISRIWVSNKWRQYGLAKKLLNCVLKNSIYGVTLSKNQIAFSQPSFSGGMLAKSFNGMIHKSGEVLLPVYIE